MSFKGFKKAINRLPQTMQESMGMQAAQTKDDEFEFYQQQFQDLNALSLKLQDASDKYRMSIEKMVQHQVSFAKTLVEVYEDIESNKFSSGSNLTKWSKGRSRSDSRVQTDEASMARAKLFLNAAVAVEEQITPHLEVVLQRKVTEPCRDYVGMHKTVQKSIVKRQHKRIDLDRHQVELKTLQKKAAAKDAKSTDERKVYKQQTVVESSQRDYDSVNDVLKQQLPSYIQQRVSFIDPILKDLLTFHAHLFLQMHHILNQEKGLAGMVDMSVGTVDGWERTKDSGHAMFDSITLFTGVRRPASDVEFDSEDTQSLPAYSPAVATVGQPPLYPTPFDSAPSSTTVVRQQAPQPPISTVKQQPPVYGQQANPFGTFQPGKPAGPKSQPSLVQAAKAKPPPPKPQKPGHLAAPGPQPKFAIALYDFSAQQAGDLSFNVGDRFEILEKTQDANGWWKGNLRGQVGIFPGSYVKLE